MNFSAWSIRNPVPALLLFFLLTVLGVIGFQRLEIQDFPDMDLPTIQVTASLEGAAPSQLETEVARKIEDKLASLTQLDHITTTITDGSVRVSVSFEIDKDSEAALSEVRNAVDGARAELPASMASPMVSKLTSSGSAILTYTIESNRLDEQDLSWFVDNDVSRALLAVKGVASVARVGGIDREVHVDLDPSLMAGLGVTPSAVSSQLKAVQGKVQAGRAASAPSASRAAPSRQWGQPPRSPPSAFLSRTAATCGWTRSRASPTRTPTAARWRFGMASR